MTAHWSSNSVTIFTAIVYCRDEANGQLVHRSYAVVSDDLHHDKQSVYAFNKMIMTDIRQHVPWPIEHVHYWSDGAASQFKNKYNFDNLLHHEEDHQCRADWSFFATAHGKGPIDGIGGEVKRQVWRAELQGKIVVRDAEHFADEATHLCPNIFILYCPKDSITEMTAHVRDRWKSCSPLPGTQSFHFIKPMDPFSLSYGKNSIFSCPEIELTKKTMRINPNNGNGDVEINDHGESDPSDNQNPVYIQGDFVHVRLSTNNKSTNDYVACIVSVGEDLTLTFLRSSGAYKRTFVYPIIEDQSQITLHEVIAKLPMPAYMLILGFMKAKNRA